MFALALAAWRYPDEDGNPLGVRADMPAPRIACCGLKVSASADAWAALVPTSLSNAELLTQEIRGLHGVFSQAPLLGSLLDPIRSLGGGSLGLFHFDALKALLERALATEAPASQWRGESEADDASWDLALTARGLLEAAQLLEGRYHLVTTNVPYLSRGKQLDALKDYCATHYPDAKSDLANVFLERCLELAHDRGQGVVQIVMPQNWLFLTSYKKQRENLLKSVSWNLLARLGPGAFETISGEVVQAVLLTQTRVPASEQFQLRGVDVSALKSAAEKAELLRSGAEVVSVSQRGQLGNPDARVTLEDGIVTELLSNYANGLAGILNGDSPRFLKVFWEIRDRANLWSFQQTTHEETAHFGGLHNLVLYDEEGGHLREEEWIRRERLHNSDQRGQSVVGKAGIGISQMRALPAARFLGSRFDSNVATVVPKNSIHLAAIWCFCSSPEYNDAVRRIDQKVNVTNATLVKVPFDLAYWQIVAAERYPNGLPQPYSDDSPSGCSTATHSPPPTRCKSPWPACCGTAGPPRPTPPWNWPQRRVPGLPVAKHSPAMWTTTASSACRRCVAKNPRLSVCCPC